MEGGFPAGFFDRVDEGDDAAFYAPPRFVTHIDEDAIAAVEGRVVELAVAAPRKRSTASVTRNGVAESWERTTSTPTPPARTSAHATASPRRTHFDVS